MNSEEGGTQERLIVYGHNHCGLAIMIARTLKDNHIDHEWRDILHGDPVWKDELRRLAKGNLSVPTLLFPDGSVLIEPSPKKLLEKVGRPPKGVFQRLFGR
jgi:mycoredoxin